MHEEKPKDQLLRDRWKGAKGRKKVEDIIDSAKKGEDWTLYLKGLPFIDEISAREGEKYGRDLRGAEEQFFRKRWHGEEDRIPRIVKAIQEKKDWTAHLEGLPFVDDINSIHNEKCGRDLRGIDFTGYNLKRAMLGYTHLDWAYLIQTKLNGAALNGAYLSYTNLSGGDFTGANLAGASLKESVFGGAHFAKAILIEADLSGANLWEADLKGADLEKANLTDAKLNKTIFRDANLQDADLTNATGLLAGQLGGANVCNAKLPEDIKEFKSLEHVEEASKNARKIFLTMLLGCVYSWLTIATTTDVRLLTNSASSPLPIIGTAIPIVGFYWAAPLLLLGFYIYFHLCMQRLWEGLAKLPAIFPDGRPVDERIYPWLLTGLIRAHFARLRENRPAFSRLQERISIVLAWWVVPITMVFFWIRYLNRHEWWGTILHMLLLGLSSSAGMWFHYRAITTLRNEKWRGRHRQIILWTIIGCTLVIFRPQESYRDLLNMWGEGTLFYTIIIFIAVAFTVALTLVERAARAGKAQRWLWTYSFDIPVFIVLLPLFGFLNSYAAIYGLSGSPSRSRANFEEQDVSTKPANWTGKEIDLVKGAKLREANLRYCLAESAFLVYADLRWADLRNANLKGADLRNADLFWAEFQNADLRNANLENAWLGGANLQNADLRGADLENADLTGAEFQNANLVGANLQNSNLFGARLQNAVLQQANLENAWLGGANLQNADLRGADLENANLVLVNFTGAMFGTLSPLFDTLSPLFDTLPPLYAPHLPLNEEVTTNLCGSDCRGSRGLTEGQIRMAIIDRDTKLPKHLEHLKEEFLKAQKEREAPKAKKKGQPQKQPQKPKSP